MGVKIMAQDVENLIKITIDENHPPRLMRLGFDINELTRIAQQMEARVSEVRQIGGMIVIHEGERKHEPFDVQSANLVRYPFPENKFTFIRGQHMLELERVDLYVDAMYYGARLNRVEVSCSAANTIGHEFTHAISRKAVDHWTNPFHNDRLKKVATLATLVSSSGGMVAHASGHPEISAPLMIAGAALGLANMLLPNSNQLMGGDLAHYTYLEWISERAARKSERNDQLLSAIRDCLTVDLRVKPDCDFLRQD